MFINNNDILLLKIKYKNKTIQTHNCVYLIIHCYIQIY